MMIRKLLIRGFRSFRNCAVELRPDLNIVVGPNEGGKSTLLEAISMVFRGRIGGKWIGEELNPYWVNVDDVAEFFEGDQSDTTAGWPEILIEAYLEDIDDPHLQKLKGAVNELKEDVPGLRVRIAPSPDYAEELDRYRQDPDAPHLVLSDYYDVEWQSFDGNIIGRAPKGTSVAVIDSKTIRSTAGLDHHTRQLLTDFVDEATGAGISIAMRSAREQVTASTLQTIEAHRDKETGESLHDKPITLRMDQSAGAAWQNSVIPTVQGIPFALAGEGQQASVKVALALSQSRTKTKLALIEEPENHLSHTRLRRLLARIEQLSSGRQVVVTTHSSFVLNRLGLDQLLLVSGGQARRIDGITADTAKYFKKLSGYDSLRVVLADRAVLVEGPSDELIFQRAYRDANNGRSPMDDGIDVISMSGLAFRRALELATILDRRVAVVRDNDGKAVTELEGELDEWLKPQRRQLFVGDPDLGKTLEPQIVSHNSDQAVLNALLGRKDARLDSTHKWMHDNKTESALRILEAVATSFTTPAYIADAVKFVSP